MFGSVVLEVGIGLTFMFLLASLLCSALRELIEAGLKSRATDLEKGIAEILGAKDDPGALMEFYKHPIINCLYRGTYRLPSSMKGQIPNDTASAIRAGDLNDPGIWSALKRRQDLPTYISSANFAIAALSMAIPADCAGPGSPAGVLSVASLRETASKIQGNDQLRTMLVTALDGAQNDLDRARKNLEAWYDAAMDRVSGAYRRRTQGITFVLGLLAAVVFNIDAIRVADHLATDKTYREAVVRDAASFLKAPDADGLTADSEPLKARLDTIRTQIAQSGFAIGWSCSPTPLCQEADRAEAARTSGPDAKASPGAAQIPQFAVNRPFNGLSTIGGWLVTALAISLGAPFWFDVLNKFMVVRSTVKPAEKSGQEASKDSWPPSADDKAPAVTVMLARPPRAAAGK